MAPPSGKTERLLDLLALLLSARRPLTFAEIREQFPEYRSRNRESGGRKFERDKSELLLLGVPLRCIRKAEDDELEEDAYVVDRARYLLPELDLRPDEMAALAVTAEVARLQPGFPYGEELASALRKIGFDAGPPEAPGDLRLDLPVAAASRELPRSLRVLETAVRLRKRVRAGYRKLGAPSSQPRSLEPYGLVYRRGAWLLVARDADRGERNDAVRTFRVDRLSGVRLAAGGRAPDFERPPAERLDLVATVRRSPWTFEVKLPPEDVQIEVEADARWIAEEDFGPLAMRDQLASGAVRIAFPCANPDYVVHRTLAEGGRIVVLRPTELRRQVRDAALRAAGGGGGAVEQA